MRTFTYKARDKSGAAAGGDVQARSRAEAVRALAARGLTLVSIAESARAAVPPTRRPSACRAAILLGLGIAAAIALLFSFRPLSGSAGRGVRRVRAQALPSSESRQPPARRAAVAGTAIRKPQAVQSSASPASVPESAARARPSPAAAKASTQKEPFYTPHMATNHVYVQIFPTQMENLLSRVARATRSGTPMMIPHNPAFFEDFTEGLNHQISVSPDDPEDIVQLKEDVMRLKAEALQLSAKGYTPEEIFRTVADEHNKMAREVLLAQRKVSSLAAAGDAEGAAALAAETNAKYKDQGQREVTVPGQEEEEKEP